MKTYTMRVLVAVMLAFGFFVPVLAGGGDGAYKLGGAWVAKVIGAPGQWSYVISADPSGRRASGHGSVDVGFHPDSICPLYGYGEDLFEPTDSQSPILVNMKMTGPDTVSYYSIWYGLKDRDPDPFPGDISTSEIVLIGVVTGELEFTGPGKALGTHNFAVYYPDQDADGDGFPDEGEQPACEFPSVTIDTRLPMPE